MISCTLPDAADRIVQCAPNPTMHALRLLRHCCLQIVRHPDGGSRGFGFVTFATEASADEVMLSTTHDVNGRTVEVKRAVPREAMGGGEGGRGGPARGGRYGGGGGYGGGGYGGRGGGYGGWWGLCLWRLLGGSIWIWI
jgi:uncharacterized membrane protein YgcG